MSSAYRRREESSAQFAMETLALKERKVFACPYAKIGITLVKWIQSAVFTILRKVFSLKILTSALRVSKEAWSYKKWKVWMLPCSVKRWVSMCIKPRFATMEYHWLKHSPFKKAKTLEVGRIEALFRYHGPNFSME